MTFKRSIDQNRRYHAMLRSVARSMVFEQHSGVIPACLDLNEKGHKCPDCKQSRKMRKEIDAKVEELHLLCRFSFLGKKDKSGFYTALPSTTELSWHEFSDYYIKSQGALSTEWPDHYHDAPDDKHWNAEK